MMRYNVEKYSGMRVSAYVVDAAFRKMESFDGLPVVCFETCPELFPQDEYVMMICLGYKGMNKPRYMKTRQAVEMGYEIQGFIHPTAFIADNVSLGQGNIVMENAVISFGVQMGDGNIVWNGCNISHGCEIGDFNYFSPGTTLGGKVKCGSFCFAGLNSTIRSARSIADKTLIGASAYINNDTIADGVYVPVRTLSLENKKSSDFY